MYWSIYANYLLCKCKDTTFEAYRDERKNFFNTYCEKGYSDCKKDKSSDREEDNERRQEEGQKENQKINHVSQTRAVIHSCFAERGGFEPPKRFRRLHAFQACLFNHSSIFPCFAVEILSVYIKPGAKLRFYFEITLFRTGKTHCQAFGNIFFAVLQVISYTSSVVRP